MEYKTKHQYELTMKFALIERLKYLGMPFYNIIRRGQTFQQLTTYQSKNKITDGFVVTMREYRRLSMNIRNY